MFFADKGDFERIFSEVVSPNLKNSPFSYNGGSFSMNDENLCFATPGDTYSDTLRSCARSASQCDALSFVVLPCSLDYDQANTDEWQKAIEELERYNLQLEDGNFLSRTKLRLRYKSLEWATRVWQLRQFEKKRAIFTRMQNKIKGEVEVKLSEHQEKKFVLLQMIMLDEANELMNRFANRYKAFREGSISNVDFSKEVNKNIKEFLDFLQKARVKASFQPLKPNLEDIIALSDLKRQIGDRYREIRTKLANLSEHAKFDANRIEASLLELDMALNPLIENMDDKRPFVEPAIWRSLVARNRKISKFSLDRIALLADRLSQVFQEIDESIDNLRNRHVRNEMADHLRDSINLESSAKFLRLVKEKTDFFHKAPQDSEVFGFPFLTKYYDELINFLEFASICERAVLGWQQTGCINLKLYVNRANERIRKIPDELNTYLELARLYMPEHALNESLMAISACLDQQKISEAVFLWDQFLKSRKEASL